MDNFMDRLAQRLNAQEMIRANVAAETAELEQLRDQVEAYDASLRKMQVLSDTNAENVVKMEAILDDYSSRLTDYASKLDGYKSGLADYEEKLKEYHEILINQGDGDYVTKDELLESFAGMKSDIQSTKDHIEDFSHKENVRVYRNVQVAVNEELGNRTEEIIESLSDQIQMTQQKTEEIMESLTNQIQMTQRKCDEMNRRISDLLEAVILIKENTDKNPYKNLLIWQIVTLIAVAADIAVFLAKTFGLF